MKTGGHEWNLLEKLSLDDSSIGQFENLPNAVNWKTYRAAVMMTGLDSCHLAIPAIVS